MKKMNLNQGWHYEDLTFGTTAEVNLPHDGTIGTQREKEGHSYFLWVGFKGLHCVYTKRLLIPAEYAGKVLYLHFGGVYRNFKVSVNGTEVLRESFGFIPCCVRIDGAVTCGAENELRVELEVPEHDHNRWYCGTGIYQDVALYAAEPEHISPYGVRVTTLSHDPARIRVEAKTEGEGELLTEILDGDTVIASASGADVTLELPSARLWSAEDPYLYTARVTLRKDGVVRDVAEERFGIRTLRWSAEEGFLVNGVKTLLKGGCIHNDNGVIGMIANDVTEERRVKNLKVTGFNAIRSAHHPMSEALKAACDKYGLYVMDEAFDVWYRMKQRSGLHQTFLEYYERVTRRMVESDYNHPCVIMYSIGNEINEIGSLKGVRVGTRIIEIIKSLDTTRPVLQAAAPKMARGFLRGVPYATVDEDEYIASRPDGFMEDMKHYYQMYMTAVYEDWDMQEGVYPPELLKEDEATLEPLMSKCDMAGYNYYNERFPNIHELHPERVLVATETNGRDIVPHWQFIQTHSYAIGDFIWTLQDHIGEANVGGRTYEGEAQGETVYAQNGRDYPWLLNDGGVVDLLGQPLPDLHRFRLVWGEEHGIWLSAQPPIHGGIAAKYGCYKQTDTIESWSFEGCEGQPTFVDVFTDAAEAEVLVNGVSVGRQKVEKLFAKFPCTYAPGEVTAVGYDAEGNELYRRSLRSAGAETRLTLSADKTKFCANGQDFVFVNIDVTDGNGTVKALPERKVSLTIDGPAVLAGFGSAEAVTEESYTAPEHTTCHGRAMAVLRSTAEAGAITLRVSTPGLADAVLTLESVTES